MTPSTPLIQPTDDFLASMTLPQLRVVYAAMLRRNDLDAAVLMNRILCRVENEWGTEAAEHLAEVLPSGLSPLA